MIKTCPICREDFKTYRSAAIYCGRVCQFKSQVRAKPRRCAHCRNEFLRPNHAVRGRMVFCSPECHREYKRAHARRVECRSCGKDFSSSNPNVWHCSVTCANASKVTAVELKCEACGKTFQTFKSSADKGRRYCSVACHRAHWVGPNHPNYRPNKTTEFGKGKGWKELAAKIRIRDGNSCQWCNRHQRSLSDTLDVHHLKARSRFTSWKAANRPENLITLCNSCHLKVESAITHNRLHKIPTKLRPPA